MKKTLFTTSLLLTFLFGLTQKKINIPYFGKIKVCEICQMGSGDANCSIESRLYDEPQKELYCYWTDGGWDNSIKCGPLPEYKVKVESSTSALVKKKSKAKFSARASADLLDLLKKKFPILNGKLEGKIKAELESTVQNEAAKSINLTYKMYYLDKDYYSDVLQPYIKNCQLPSGTRITTSISVVEVSGSWTTNCLQQAVANVLADAQFIKTIDAETQLELTRLVESVRQTNFENLSLIVHAKYEVI